MKVGKMRFSLDSSEGLTIVEVIIATAILIVVALGIAELMTGTARQESEIKLKQDAFNHQQQIRYESRIVPLPPATP